MKKMFIVAFAAVSFVACNDQKSSTTTVETDIIDTSVMSDNNYSAAPTPVPANTNTTDSLNRMSGNTSGSTTTRFDNSATKNSYVYSEGDVSYRNGKVMVWRNKSWQEADDDVRQDDDILVRRNGEVSRNGKTVQLEEGETVSKTGRFFNRAGEGIDNAWDATKRGVNKAASATKKGVNKAADAVKKGANKVGEGVKDAVD